MLGPTGKDVYNTPLSTEALEKGTTRLGPLFAFDFDSNHDCHPDLPHSYSNVANILRPVPLGRSKTLPNMILEKLTKELSHDVTDLSFDTCMDDTTPSSFSLDTIDGNRIQSGPTWDPYISLYHEMFMTEAATFPESWLWEKQSDTSRHMGRFGYPKNVLDQSLWNNPWTHTVVHNASATNQQESSIKTPHTWNSENSDQCFALRSQLPVSIGASRLWMSRGSKQPVTPHEHATTLPPCLDSAITDGYTDLFDFNMTQDQSVILESTLNPQTSRLYTPFSPEPSNTPCRDNSTSPEVTTRYPPPNDFYKPHYVRKNGIDREAWCSDCKPGRWLKTKTSEYWYDKMFRHGINATTGKFFDEPMIVRASVTSSTAGASKKSRRFSGNEGLCKTCGHWVAMGKRAQEGQLGVAWIKHAYRCQKDPSTPKRDRRTTSSSTNSSPSKHPPSRLRSIFSPDHFDTSAPSSIF